MSTERLAALLHEVEAEVGRAEAKHAPMHSPHEGHSVIREELDELWEHVRADTGRSDEARHEAIQIAAMGLRYALNLCAPLEVAQGVRVGDELAWLVERGQSMKQQPTVWWTGTDWTTDAWAAQRFVTQEACEAFIDAQSGFAIPSHGDRFGVAVRHGFVRVGDPPPPADDAGGLRAALERIRDLCDMPFEQMRREHGSEQRILVAVIPAIIDAALAAQPAPPALDREQEEQP